MISRPAADRIIRLAILGALLTACTSTAPGRWKENELFWPPAPAQARITFVTAISRPEDLGIGKGFFQWLSEVFTGEAANQLVKPMAVTVTEDNIVFVADPGVEGVHRFNPGHSEYHLIRREGNKPLPSPVALAIGANGQVYVSDSQLDTVFRIDPGSEFATPLALKATLKHPTGLAWLNESGQLLVVDTWSHDIKVFNADGSLYGTLGKRGEAPGQFNYPTHIWPYNEEHLLVTDSLNFRVQIVDYQGNFIHAFGQQGNASGNLSRPKGIAADQQGHIYVVDALLHAMQIFDAQGQLLLPVGHQGSGAGEFWLPAGIFIDKQNMIYIADSYNKRILVFRYLGDTT
ncbi:MAG: 6-bladed beta-propeller [Gammaproteobacteria bacterium]|nr:6-bladed beta-propeller [Gammaproteobacteria bacterium]